MYLHFTQNHDMMFLEHLFSLIKDEDFDYYEYDSDRHGFDRKANNFI